MSELLPCVDIGKMNLNCWHADGRNRVAKCDARVRVGGAVNDNHIELFYCFLNPADSSLRRSTFRVVEQFLQTRPQRDRHGLFQPAFIHQAHVNQIAQMHAVFVAKRCKFHPHQRVE
jgi:hypothetical protein